MRVDRPPGRDEALLSAGGLAAELGARSVLLLFLTSRHVSRMSLRGNFHTAALRLEGRVAVVQGCAHGAASSFQSRPIHWRSDERWFKSRAARSLSETRSGPSVRPPRGGGPRGASFCFVFD